MRYWINKFRYAFRGIGFSIREPSVLVHVPVAIVVMLVGWNRGLDHNQMALLTLCIAVVLAAELFNSSIESLAKSVTQEHDENIGRALDIAAGAVLVVSIAAAIVGILILF